MGRLSYRHQPGAPVNGFTPMPEAVLPRGRIRMPQAGRKWVGCARWAAAPRRQPGGGMSEWGLAASCGRVKDPLFLVEVDAAPAAYRCCSRETEVCE